MLDIIKSKQKEPKAIIRIILFMAFFLVIYTLLDDLNGGYRQMIFDYGFYLVLINVGLNIFMSLLSAYMWSLSATFVKLTGSNDKGSHATLISLIFGIFTYGCTPCLIAFFATFGITLSVAILPFMGLPYKLISLLVLVFGYLYLIREMKNPKCKIPKEKMNDSN